MPFSRLQAACKRRLTLPLLKRFRPEVETPVGRWTMRVDVRDDVIGYLLYTVGEYEPHVERLFAAMDLRGATCIDVGANIGLHTLALSEAVGPQARVIAFEPEPRNFSFLAENLRLNAAAANVTAFQKAVGAAPGTLRLALNPKNFGDHRIASATGVNGSPTIEVPVVTLDAALADVPPGAVKFMKIDVQGFEMSVLDGMTARLARHPDVTLLVEVFPEALRAAGSSGAALVARFRQLGLDGWEFHEHRLLPVAPASAYDLIEDGKDVNLVLARDAEKLRGIMARWWGRPVPPPAQG